MKAVHRVASPGLVVLFGFLSLLASGAGGQVTDPPRFAYVTNSFDSSVSTYLVDPGNGRLTWLDKMTPEAGGRPFGITVDPSDRYAYVVDNSSSHILQYTIGQDGK